MPSTTVSEASRQVPWQLHNSSSFTLWLARERASHKNGKLRRAIFSSVYNILQRNFGILLILWCSFKLWWNFCLDQNFTHKGKGPLHPHHRDFDVHFGPRVGAIWPKWLLSPSRRREAPCEGTDSPRLFTPGETKALAESKVHQISRARVTNRGWSSSLISNIWRTVMNSGHWLVQFKICIITTAWRQRNSKHFLIW
jgi:hypothetical protein